MAELWIIDPGFDGELGSVEHGLEPGAPVFVAIRSSRAGLLLFGLGIVPDEDSIDSSDNNELSVEFPMPLEAGISLAGIELPPHDESADLARIPISKDLSDQLLELWDSNEWVAAFGAMLDKPRNAWLLQGTEKNLEYLESDHEDLFYPTLDDIWTAPKQVEPGDLLFFYFLDPIKEIRFVARAASHPFFADDIEVAGDGRAGNRQWWVHFGIVAPTSPIPFSAIKEAFDGHVVIRGRPTFLPPRVVERLLPLVGDDLIETGLVAIPTGLADLPAPRDIGMSEWPVIASGALTLEHHVEDYIVEPLLRLAFGAQPEVTWTRQPRTPGGGAVDFATWRGSKLVAAIEVKLGTRFRESGEHAGSPDFGQIRRYMDELDVPGMLIDANRLFLFKQGEEWPHLVLERAAMTAEDIEAVARHLSAAE